MPKPKLLSQDELDDLREYCANRWEWYPKDVTVDRKVIRDNFLRLLATVDAHAEEIRNAKEEAWDLCVGLAHESGWIGDLGRDFIKERNRYRSPSTDTQA